MQIICISLQTDNHASASSLHFTGRMLFLTPRHLMQTNGSNKLVPWCDRRSPCNNRRLSHGWEDDQRRRRAWKTVVQLANVQSWPAALGSSAPPHQLQRLRLVNRHVTSLHVSPAFSNDINGLDTVVGLLKYYSRSSQIKIVNYVTKCIYQISPTTVLRPLYKTTSVSPRLRTGGFCRRQSFTARMPLQTATSAFWLGRRH